MSRRDIVFLASHRDAVLVETKGILNIRAVGTACLSMCDKHGIADATLWNAPMVFYQHIVPTGQ